MEEIKVIEYRPELAAAVADMWNKSREGWGGGSAITTAEQVERQEATSDNIKLYLALDGEEVVGYCSLSEYREDTGSLYIPLLNVRNDYHGKKIGKLLLLKALEHSIQLGWPRLDLYTWPGNTKAVPLYKKCGFFWEDRDETTHLMNFIPTVFNTPAVKDFFQEVDWYQYSQRVIEVKPDGRKERGFEFYEYTWEKENKSLRMEFERRGRGLRLIETDDYLIFATVEEAELVFGKEYPVYYEIVNKSGKSLKVELKGQGDKNIDFHLNVEVNVTEKTRIEGRFMVGEINEEQSVWKTHPAVTALLKINGEEATFRLGIVPKFPVKITAKAGNSQDFIGSSSHFYIDVENNYDEEVVLRFQLPKASFMEIHEDDYTVPLMPKEKKSIAISYQLSDFGFYEVILPLKVRLNNRDDVSFEKKIGVAFKGIGARFSGESEEYWQIHNGIYEVLLNKRNNLILLGRSYMEGSPTRIMSPKLGKPYSSEYSKKPADLVEFYEEKGAMVLKATYHSEAFSNLQLITYVKLYAEGLIEQSYEVENLSATETSTAVWLNHPVYFELSKSIIPYDDGIVELQDGIGTELKDWEGIRIKENWIFTKGDKIPRGICWSPKYQINLTGWFTFFEYSLGEVPPKGSVTTEALYISLGAFQEWSDFRKFALKRNNPTPKKVKPHLELTLNQHNPIVKDQCIATLTSHRSEYFDGELEVRLRGDEVSQHNVMFNPDEEQKEIQLELMTKEDQAVDVVSLRGNIFTQENTLHALILKQGNDNIKEQQIEEEGRTTYFLDNGVVQLKLAPDFYPTLSSLVYKGQEWLDTSYPTLKAKSWWNPWSGGISYSMEGISNNSISKEKSKAHFVTLKDNHNNQWRGIKLQTTLEDHKEYGGLQWNQYFLLLPGIPVVCSTMEIIQGTGCYLKDTEWFSAIFLQLKEDNRLGWIKTNKKGDTTTYHLGKGSVEISSDTSLLCGIEGREDLLQIIADIRATNLDFYINKEVTTVRNTTRLNLKDGENVFTTPVFYLFSEKAIPEDALEDLKNILF